MSVTHGGRARTFRWVFQDDELTISSESGIHHVFLLREVLTIIQYLKSKFGEDWIPLANNVEKIHSGTERPGVGTAIYRHRPGDTLHAQGASYLGVVLEEIGVFEWNGEKKGIAWRLQNPIDDLATLRLLLTQ